MNPNAKRYLDFFSPNRNVCMKELKVTTVYTEYDSVAELPDEAQALMRKAEEARANAYAPYSKFRVGAAILLDNGQVILGNNQENAAFPSGLCAERTALYHAGSNYPHARIMKIAISAGADEAETNRPIPPCGNCRQSIAEYESKQKSPIEIYFTGKTGPVYKSNSLQDLLPFTFDKDYL